MAGAFWQDKDEHVSCAAAKLAEGYVCSKQSYFELVLSAYSTGGQYNQSASLMI
jgi:hypothetical protein